MSSLPHPTIHRHCVRQLARRRPHRRHHHQRPRRPPMPSLRRTASSPAVRSSPYGLSSFNGAQVARGHAHRRSSGSETTNRRVLQDIEWWRVTDGQFEPGAGDLESEEPSRDVVHHNLVAGGFAAAALFNTDTGVDHPFTQSELWPSTDVRDSLSRILTAGQIVPEGHIN